MRTRFLVLMLCAGLLWAASATSVRAQGSGSSRLAQPSPRQPPANYQQPAPAYRQPAPTYRQPAPTYPQSVPTYRQPYTSPAQPEPIAPRPPTTEEYAQTLWTFLVRPQSPYTQWSPLSGKEGMRAVEGPHGPNVRLYANAAAVADPKGLPPGSILILEDYAADRKARTGINILYRVKGYDPKNGDWYSMKFLETGTLVRTPPDKGDVPIAGRVAACIDCHRKAAGNDFVYSNDPTAAASPKE